MNKQLIESQLNSILSQDWNHYPTGQSVFRIIQSSYIEQGDESAMLNITLQGYLPDNAQDEDYNKETLACEQIKAINPNDLISDPEDSESMDSFEQLSNNNFLTIWRTRSADTYIMQETDTTFYITIIESGQY